MKKTRTDDLNLFYRQLAAMTASGMTVPESIQALTEDEEESAIRNIAMTMSQDMKSGKSAGEAVFGQLRVLRGLPGSAIDRSDPQTISRFLQDMAEFSEKRQALKRFLGLSFAYPGLVAIVMLLVASLMMIVAVPAFASMFADSGQLLPFPTRIVIALSNLVARYGFVIPVLIVALIIIYRTRKNWFYTIADKIPGIGRLNRKIAAAEALRSLSLMARLNTTSGEALHAAAASVTNDFYAGQFSGFASGSKTFSDFVVQARQRGLLPSMVSQTVRAGERNNTLAVSLHETARFMEQDAEKTYNRFSVLLYPLTIIMLGIIVGFIVIAMYMPIFQMGSVTG